MAHSEENPYGWHFVWAISSEGLKLRALGARHSKSLLLRMIVVPNGLGEAVCCERTWEMILWQGAASSL